MTRYATITNLGDDLVKLVGRNIIPMHILDWKVYYEAYLEETRMAKSTTIKKQKTLAAAIAADRYRISTRTMFSVIAFMEGA